MSQRIDNGGDGEDLAGRGESLWFVSMREGSTCLLL